MWQSEQLDINNDVIEEINPKYQQTQNSLLFGQERKFENQVSSNYKVIFNVIKVLLVIALYVLAIVNTMSSIPNSSDKYTSSLVIAIVGAVALLITIIMMVSVQRWTKDKCNQNRFSSFENDTEGCLKWSRFLLSIGFIFGLLSFVFSISFPAANGNSGLLNSNISNFLLECALNVLFVSISYFILLYNKHSGLSGDKIKDNLPRLFLVIIGTIMLNVVLELNGFLRCGSDLNVPQPLYNPYPMKYYIVGIFGILCLLFNILCGASGDNDSIPTPRLVNLMKFIPEAFIIGLLAVFPVRFMQTNRNCKTNGDEGLKCLSIMFMTIGVHFVLKLGGIYKQILL